MHVAGSVGLLGVDATVAVLGVAGARGSDPRTVYPAADLLGGALLVPLALVALVTGVVLGALTPWGLLRHWWVAVKLALTGAGAVLAVVVLTPALGAAAQAATAGDVLPTAQRLELVRDAGAASGVLGTTVALPVYKPFGRLRGRRRQVSGGASPARRAAPAPAPRR
ncbi:hypothetical protein SAMN05661080_03005 [Modestobacter sp. DSM 44400]|nr:hypothetical protein SAMN05661080_03005 [Modestobacter sp. DSM 44400]